MGAFDAADTRETPLTVRPASWPQRLPAGYWLPPLLVLLGIELRVRQYLGNRSLWLDEASITDSLLHRSYRGLLQPLAHGQGAPVGWLWAERACVDLFGSGERALRLVPLLSGIGVILLVWYAATLLLPGGLVPVALLVADLSPRLLYYSTEVKQYESDALVFLVLLVLALRLHARPPRTRAWRWALLAWVAAAALAVWCSHPAIFAIVGMSTAIGIELVIQRQGRAIGWFTMASTAWIMSFLAVWRISLRQLGNNRGLHDYWQFSFLPPNGGLLDTTTWVGQRLSAFLHDPTGFSLVGLAALLVIAGGLCLGRRQPVGLLLLVTPIAVMVAASGVDAYPFAERLALAGVPATLLVVVGALWAPWQGRWRAVHLAVAAIGLVALLVAPARLVLPQTAWVRPQDELRTVLVDIRARRAPGDWLLLDLATRPAFRYYYGPRLHLAATGIFLLVPSRMGCSDVATLRRVGAQQHRAWLVFTAHLPPELHDSRSVLARWSTIADVEAVIRQPGVTAYLVTPRATGQLRPLPADLSYPERCLALVMH